MRKKPFAAFFFPNFISNGFFYSPDPHADPFEEMDLPYLLFLFLK